MRINKLIAILIMSCAICIIITLASKAIYKYVQEYNCIADRELTQIMEMSYFEGQKDCINGNIKIKLDSTTNKYIWVKPPFDSMRPIWNPQDGYVLH